jgi:hypothetical protein
MRHRGLHGGLANGRILGQKIVGRDPTILAIDTKPGTGVALRVNIDNQDFLTNCRECGGQIDGGGRLADAAFLVGDGDDPVLRIGASRWVRGFSCAWKDC